MHANDAGQEHTLTHLADEIRAGRDLETAAGSLGLSVDEAADALFAALLSSEVPEDDVEPLRKAASRAERLLGRTRATLLLQALVLDLRVAAGAGRPGAVRLVGLLKELDRDGATPETVALRIRAIRRLHDAGQLDAALARCLGNVGGDGLTDIIGADELRQTLEGRALLHESMAMVALALDTFEVAMAEASAAVLLWAGSLDPQSQELRRPVIRALDLQLEAANKTTDPAAALHETLKTIEDTCGLNDPLVCEAKSLLWQALARTGMKAEAEALLPEVVADHERILGPDHRNTWTARLMKEVIAPRDFRTTSGAVSHWRGLVEGISGALGEQDELVFSARYELMQALGGHDATAGAEYAKELLRDASKTLGHSNPVTQNVQRLINHRRSHHDEAELYGGNSLSASNKLSGSRKTKERVLAQFREGIAQHGWIVHAIGAECSHAGHEHAGHSHGPDFGYTNGLSRYRDHPEFIVMGLPQLAVTEFLNTLGQRVREGERFDAGQLVEGLAEGYQVMLLEVSPENSAKYLTMANAIYRLPGRAPIRALQVVMPDADRRWPWEVGVTDTFRAAQPLLGPEIGPA